MIPFFNAVAVEPDSEYNIIDLNNFGAIYYDANYLTKNIILISYEYNSLITKKSASYREGHSTVKESQKYVFLRKNRITFFVFLKLIFLTVIWYKSFLFACLCLIPCNPNILYNP